MNNIELNFQALSEGHKQNLQQYKEKLDELMEKNEELIKKQNFYEKEIDKEIEKQFEIKKNDYSLKLYDILKRF